MLIIDNVTNEPVINREIQVAEGERVVHIRLFTDCNELSHESNVVVTQAANSHYQLHQISFGGANIRTSTTVNLNGPGAECQLFGLDLLSQKQIGFNATTINHNAPHCISHELFKGIFDDESNGTFDGTVLVAEGAVKTQSSQTNRNLLLSKTATVNTRPHLEIYNDDVKCVHGATVGQLDPDALFYLQARGIHLAQAKSMLTQAFAKEIVDGIPDESVKEALEANLTRRFAATSPGRRGEK
jgi:Fe-S cluster assembly protein SufD